MNFVAVVCGADPLWDVPSVTDDPVSMLDRLVAPATSEAVVATGSGPVDEGATAPRFPSDATHTLFVCRPSWQPAMRRLATLLRAHDATRHYAVLVTDRLPLASALVAEHVNALDLEPGRAAREVDRLLRLTESGAWVRRPGRLTGARVSWWDVVRSTWAKDGYVASGAGPVAVDRAGAELWSQRLSGVRAVYLSGEVAETPGQALRTVGVREQLRDRDVPPGTKVLVGRQRSFEFAAPRWGPDEALPDQDDALRRCDSCGGSILDFCPFCHAQWGEASTPRGPVPQLTVQGDHA